MAIANDPFTRANGTLYTGDWSGSGNFQITSNHVDLPAYNIDSIAAWKTITNDFGDAQFSQVTLTVTGTGAGDQGSGVCLQYTGSSYYRIVIDHGSIGNVSIGRTDAGSFVSLKQVTKTWTDGQTLYVSFDGAGLIAVRIGGAFVTSYDDSANPLGVLSGGQPGIFFSSNITTGTWDDWYGGDGNPGEQGAAAPSQIWTPRRMPIAA